MISPLIDTDHNEAPAQHYPQDRSWAIYLGQNEDRTGISELYKRGTSAGREARNWGLGRTTVEGLFSRHPRMVTNHELPS